jgi:hypothetical protein
VISERARWFGFGIPLLSLVGVTIATILHIGLALPWSDVAVPVGVYAALQVVTFISMFWVRNITRVKKDYRPGITTQAIYSPQ